MNEVKFIFKCCCCQKIRTDSGWEKELKSQLEEVRYSHGYCPDCIEIEIHKMEEQLEKIAG